ncbi:MAG: histidine phosphatase family protein [Patescibacteria group bacterium]
MKLYLVRHGESEANIKDLYHFPETSLSKDGVNQAEILAKRLRNLSFDYIYSSDLKRALHTAEIIARHIDKKVESISDLREFRKPSKLWGKSDEDQESMTYVKLQKENFNNPEWKLADDESFNDLKIRANKVLKDLLQKHLNKKILIVSHGAMIKMMTALAVFTEELSPITFWHFWHNLWIKNTGITIIEYKQNKWSLITWNDISHC